MEDEDATRRRRRLGGRWREDKRREGGWKQLAAWLSELVLWGSEIRRCRGSRPKRMLSLSRRGAGYVYVLPLLPAHPNAKARRSSGVWRL
jgi:hypothetical protein